MSALFPSFLKLGGKKVVVVGGGAVAASKLDALLAAGARVTVVAPEIRFEREGVELVKRPFQASDLDGAWFVVAAAPAEVNRAVSVEADARQIFVNAVDDAASASAYLGGVVRRGGVTVAVSTDGVAPALAGLLREGLEAILPDDLEAWVDLARVQREKWKAAGVPIELRRGLLLAALVAKYAAPNAPAASDIALPLPSRGRGRGGKDATQGGEGTERSWMTRAECVERSLPSPCPSPREGRGDARSRVGFVSLVGAGPGDPGLLTQRGAERLREADLVLYDALVSPELLSLCGSAQRFPVGKRAGRKSIEQRTIERLMIRAARRGKRVVRLKAGDPFVLGRGGEEALALAAAGVSFEVVPGLSSAIAAPALAGIPVTHRGLASGFLVVSGHDDSEALRSLAPGAATVVVLMGVGRRAEISDTLIGRGWPGRTPAAIVGDASTPRQTVWAGRLDELSSAPAPTPAVLVIGDVVTALAASKEEPLHVHG